MPTISSYMEDKKAKAKAQSDAGLGGLLKVLAGGVTGFFTGGPVGALIGAGTGLLSAATSGAAPEAKDVQSAMDKFNAWKQGSYAPKQPVYGGDTSWISAASGQPNYGYPK